MRITFSGVVATLIILGIALFVGWPMVSYASSVAPDATAFSFWRDLWPIFQPLVALFATVFVPGLFAWVAARLVALLKISSDAKRAEYERQLREALHQSAVNALNFALTKSGLTPAAATIGPVLVSEAVRYVETKNPEAVKKLGVTGDALRDIITSKIPIVLQR
ncbi:MAG: hypothetical protein DI537_42035 [Stutzerimonas stutzeri]|nr:MAG: hypothetical protein DI537_42035 [Stutzerimonas stutzeri]